MMKLLKTLYTLAYWNNINALQYLFNGEYNMRCETCNLFGCYHMRMKRHLPMSSMNNPIGDHLDNIIDALPVMAELHNDATGVRDFPIRQVRVADEPKKEEPKTEQRILIPPVSSSIKVEGPSVLIDKRAQVLNTDFIKCVLCNGNVHTKYLAKHQLIHLHEYIPPNKTSSTSVTPSGATSIIHVNNTTPSGSGMRGSDSRSTTNTRQIHSHTRSEPKFRPIERYKFRRFDNVCVSSSVSHDGRYSEFTLTLWQPEVKVESFSWVGHSTSSYKDLERFFIHIVHDTREDYYTITSKLLKRSAYTSYDMEESLIPDRICEQHEIMSEVKKILLFYKISPKITYKKFRKLFKQGIVVECDANGSVITARSENSNDLAERLKKGPTTSSKTDDTDHDYYGCG
jgi:hypothetical protein